jgi:uncharacterized protein (UPF0332 family)
MQLVEQAARDLKSAQNCSDDGDYRSACDRSYFAMYHVVRAMLESRNIYLHKWSDVISNFEHEFVFQDRISPQYGEWIRIGNAKMVNANHSFTTKCSSKDALESIELAKHFIVLANEKLGDVSDADEDEA